MKLNITFLIGNGFDLNLGMKTRYTDMYDSYINSESSNEVIAKFKEDLKKDEHKHYENWSDFEMGMAFYARNFSNESDFVACIRDFKTHMVRWLKNEEVEFGKTTLSNNILGNEMVNSIVNFHSGSTPNVKYTIEDIIFQENHCDCNFITFNYTFALDAIIARTSKLFNANQMNYIIHEPIHIHGDLTKDVVLGVDNKEQINSFFRTTRKTDLAFIKPEFNQVYDYRRVNKAIDLINNSCIICTYGFSFGKSDETWIRALKNWILADEQNHLICYIYDDKIFPSYNYDERIEREEELKETIFEKMKFTYEQVEIVRDKIHVPVSYSIFNFIEKTNTDELVAV